LLAVVRLLLSSEFFNGTRPDIDALSRPNLPHQKGAPLPRQTKLSMSPDGTEPPIWDVLATVAIGGDPDMTRATQFSRD